MPTTRLQSGETPKYVSCPRTSRFQYFGRIAKTKTGKPNIQVTLRHPGGGGTEEAGNQHQIRERESPIRQNSHPIVRKFPMKSQKPMAEATDLSSPSQGKTTSG